MTQSATQWDEEGDLLYKEMLQQARSGEVPIEALRAAAVYEFSPEMARQFLHEVDTVAEYSPQPASGRRLVAGGAFVLDSPATPPTIWGAHGQVLWSAGESLMICGPTGVGKSTLAGQLVRCRLGLQTTLLDWPVIPGEGHILYLAADRPPQVARSLQRMFHPSEREILDELLVVWKGPPPADFAKAPETLLELARSASADTVIVDSLKDVARDLSKDETGSGYNNARQLALVNGVQIVELHHQRKGGADNKRPMTLDDVYGSTWLTAGAGSVVLLWGQAGDLVVELAHLKQPAEVVGPLRLAHDHGNGETSIYAQLDVYDVVRRANRGMTAQEIARLMFDAADPKPNHVEQARRRLDALVKQAKLHREDGQRGGASAQPARYYLTAEAAA